MRVVQPLATYRNVVVAIIIETLATCAALTFLFGLRHRRGLGDRGLDARDEVAQNRIAEAECPGELTERLLIALDVEQHVVRLVDFGYRIRELPAAPVFEAVDLP